MLARQACFPGDRHASVDYVFASKTERYASGAWHLVAVLSGEMLARQACFPGDRHASVAYAFASKNKRYASGAWHLAEVPSGERQRSIKSDRSGLSHMEILHQLPNGFDIENFIVDFY